MPRCLCLALVLSLLSLHVAAAENFNFFKNLPWVPGPLDDFEHNNVYAIGSKLNVMWATNFSSISLVLWQQGNQSYEILIDRQPVSKSLMWDVNLDGKFNVSSSTLASPNGRFSCHEFNITEANSQASTTSTPSTSNDSVVSNSAKEAEDESTQQSSSNGLSSDAKIGIGVGAGIGAALLIGSVVLSWLFWRRSKRVANTADQVEPRLDTDVTKIEPQDYKDQPAAKSDSRPLLQTRELSGEAQTHELFSTHRGHELPGGMIGT